MTNKHLQNHRPLALALLVAAAITGCGSTVDDQDAGPQCPAGEIFWFVDGSCGRASSAGACGAVTTGCYSENLVCGCDGTVYQTVCEANEARVDITFADQCAAPQGTYACGTDFCARYTTYCHELDYEGSDSGDISCEPIPSECASAPSCECLVDWWSFDECESDGMGGLYATEIVYTD